MSLAAQAYGVQLYGVGAPNIVSIFDKWSPAYLFIRDDVRYACSTLHQGVFWTSGPQLGIKRVNVIFKSTQSTVLFG